MSHVIGDYCLTHRQDICCCPCVYCRVTRSFEAEPCPDDDPRHEECQ